MKTFLQVILNSLYIYSSNISWSVLSYPSTDPVKNSLNVASPSLTSEYWISTFKSNDRPIFCGSFPEWVEYSSLSAYDDNGIVIQNSSVNSYQILNYSCINLLEDVSDQSLSRPYAVIHRVYRSPIHPQSLQPSEKFSISLNNKTQALATEEQARNSGKQLESELQKTVGKDHSDIFSNTKLYKPSERHLSGLFPNEDALYLITSPTRNKSCIRIQSCLGDELPWIKYIGFITTDMYTTATSGTVELKWRTCYTLFVTRPTYSTLSCGYDSKNKTHYSLLWDVGVIFPTLVMRIIDISCSMGECRYGINNITHMISSSRCQNILGSLYPNKITFS